MSSWRFWIDRGGTFTDVVARDGADRMVTRKLLSENPGRYEDAAIAGIRDILGLPDGAPIPPGMIAEIRMGTTVATNALLERRGTPVLLVINQGLRDLLRIGNQARPRLFDLDIRLPPVLYADVLEVSARLAADGVEVAPLDEPAISAALEAARASGLDAVAIALIHAWAHPEQERRIAALAAGAGFNQISTSHETGPLLRLVPRGQTTVADAYLSPILRRYVDRVAAALPDVPLFFMQSHGGLARADRFAGKDAILSGPAGGIVGAARTAAAAGFDRVIGFDMGGTSTDVALYAGRFERATETEIAGVRLRVPMMAIHTVAAGGGSVLGFDGARLTRRARLGRGASGSALLSPWRSTDGDGCEPAARQNPAGAFPGDLRAGRRSAARCRMRWRAPLTRSRRKSPPPPGSGRRRWRSRKASCGSRSGIWPAPFARSASGGGMTRRASRSLASAAPAASMPAWWPMSSA